MAPLTALMPAPLNGLDLPADIEATSDHLAALGFAASHHPDPTLEVENACTTAEVQCASTCVRSPEAGYLVTLGIDQEIPLAVVSNNSTSAVRVFLERFGWPSSFATLSCREPGQERNLKPDPYLINRALTDLGVRPDQAAFVGDSESDVQGGLAAGVAVIGLGKTSERAAELKQAGADAVMHRSHN